MDAKKSESEFHKMGDDIKQFVDSMRVKAHLAELDTKDAWEQMEKSLGRMADDLRHTRFRAKQYSQEAKVQSHLAMMETKEKWDLLKEDLTAVSQKLNGVHATIDKAKIKMHLGKLDAEDYWKEKMNSWKSDENGLAAKAEESWEKLKKEVKSLGK